VGGDLGRTKLEVGGPLVWTFMLVVEPADI
jgi:hypothetical protein